MKYKLFIDDDAGKPGMADFRNPPENEDDWIVANSSDAAIAVIDMFGPPHFISFDHDLGIKDDGALDTAKTVCYYLWDNYPHAKIDYVVHSRNPEGTAWIKSFMNSWEKSKTL